MPPSDSRAPATPLASKRISLNFASPRRTDWSAECSSLGRKTSLVRELSNVRNGRSLPAGCRGCKTFPFSWHFLALTASERHAECTTGAQVAVSRWWIDNWQPPQANLHMHFSATTTRPLPQHPSEAEPCHNDKQRPVVSNANGVWGKCAACGNKSSSRFLTHTFRQPFIGKHTSKNVSGNRK